MAPCPHPKGHSERSIRTAMRSPGIPTNPRPCMHVRTLSDSNPARSRHPHREESHRLIRRSLQLAALCLCTLAARAAEHHGTVTFNNLPIPGVTVTATNGTTTQTAVTDQQGLYSFPDLPPGIWKLTLEMQLFAPQTQQLTIALDADHLSRTWELKLLPTAEIMALATVQTSTPTLAVTPPPAQSGKPTEKASTPEGPRPRRMTPPAPPMACLSMAAPTTPPPASSRSIRPSATAAMAAKASTPAISRSSSATPPSTPALTPSPALTPPSPPTAASPASSASAVPSASRTFCAAAPTSSSATNGLVIATPPASPALSLPSPSVPVSSPPVQSP